MNAWKLPAMLVLVLTSGAGVLPCVALAQEQPEATESYPSRYTERPLTLPALHLRVDPRLALWIFHPDSEEEALVVAVLNAGVGFGVIDDLEVGLGTSPIAPLMGSSGWQLAAGLGGALTPSFARGFLPW